jgi:hypothetical protein
MKNMMIRHFLILKKNNNNLGYLKRPKAEIDGYRLRGMTL